MKTTSLEEKILSLNLMDDRFMSVALNHRPSVEYLLRVFLDQDQLTVKNVTVQDKISQVQARSAILDVHVVDEKGDHYNIEIHNGSRGVLEKARYYGSSLDVNLAKTGSNQIQLPRVSIIFLCSEDVLKLGKTFNCITTFDHESGQAIDMGKEYYIINSEVKEDNLKSELMQYIENSDPDNLDFGPLSARVRDLKLGEEQTTMREYMYDWEREEAEQWKKEGKLEGQKEMLTDLTQRWQREGIEINDIAQRLDLSVSEVEALLEESLQAQN